MKIAKPVFSRNDARVTGSKAPGSSGAVAEDLRPSFDFAPNGSNDQKRARGGSSRRGLGAPGEELIDTGRHTATLGRELAEIVKARDSTKDAKGPRFERTNLEDIVMSSL